MVIKMIILGCIKSFSRLLLAIVIAVVVNAKSRKLIGFAWIYIREWSGFGVAVLLRSAINLGLRVVAIMRVSISHVYLQFAFYILLMALIHRIIGTESKIAVRTWITCFEVQTILHAMAGSEVLSLIEDACRISCVGSPSDVVATLIDSISWRCSNFWSVLRCKRPCFVINQGTWRCDDRLLSDIVLVVSYLAELIWVHRYLNIVSLGRQTIELHASEIGIVSSTEV